MKLLYLVHQYFPRHVGGTEVYLRGLVRRAVAAGHAVRVVTSVENASGDPADFHVEETAYESVPLVEVHFNLSVTPQPALYEYDNAFTRQTVERELAVHQPDIVHALHAMKLSGSALAACYAANVPVIVTLCDFWFICPQHTLLRWNDTICFGPRHPLDCVKCVRQLHGVVPRLRWLKPRTVPQWVRDVRALAGRNHSLRVQLAGAQRIIALSQFQKQMFVDNGYAARCIDVIPHGLEVESLAADGMSHLEFPTVGSGRSSRLDVSATPDNPRLVGYIGSLVPFKGAHVLLAALAAAPDLPVRCLIFGSLIGGDAYVARLRAMAQRDPRVELRGDFAPEEMGRVMREFEVLAMPALWHENGPLAVKAALYLGQPVLASRLGSLTEMVDVGRTGWLVAPGDVPAWTAALRRIAEEPVPRFTPPPIKTIDDNAREMLELYGRVAEEQALCV